MQDREADLDTLRKAGRNLRERLDEKDIETRNIMERVRALGLTIPHRMTVLFVYFNVSFLLKW